MSESAELLGRKVAINECKKFYVQRDYGQGLAVCFSTDFPEDLNGKVDKDIWVDFIKQLNGIYAEAEECSTASAAESLLGFLTCYLSRLCVKPIWTNKLEEAVDLINETNDLRFIKCGVYVCNPIDKGLRVIEVVLLNEPMPVTNRQTTIENNKATALQPR
uniref:Ras modification protein ERF4 n=1 Tax=Ditylenchus dipsaci TaxID=166011 RepID=A0A915DFF8_9BILA